MTFELDGANDLSSRKDQGRRERRRWGRRRDHLLCDTCAVASHGAVCGELRLCEAGVGDAVTVTGLNGDESFRSRIMAMGILPGVTLRVVGGGSRQPLLVALPGSRCVLDRRSSEKIAVRGERSAADHERTRR